MSLLQRLKLWFQSLLFRRQPEQHSAVAEEKPASEPVVEVVSPTTSQTSQVTQIPIAPLASPTELATQTHQASALIPPPTPRMNRHDRRVYERARRRHDKFVTPQGPVPIKVVRDETQTPPVRAKRKVEEDDADVVDDPNDELIVDEWLKGDGERVLYDESEFWGQFNFRDTILDQLDRYWVYLERMKKHDQGAYDLYRQIGATLLPYCTTHSWSDKPEKRTKTINIEDYKKDIVLPPWFRHNWPAFGCCAYGTNPRDEASELIPIDNIYHLTPKFLYFNRVKKLPWHIQPVHGGKLYVMTVWWDRTTHVGKHKWKWGRPEEFALQVNDDGKTIRVLKTLKDGKDSKTRPWWDWRIPYAYEEWAKQYGLTAQLHLSRLFCDAAKMIEYAAGAMLRIEVSKGDLTAVFGIDPRRTSYFFQDRDIILNEHGVKKRIFHMVRPHVRSDGTPVPTHFRGLREFTWAGYKVWISVPGRDHFMPLEMDIPSTYLGRYERKPKGLLTEGEVGRRLKKAMHEGYKRH